MKTILTNEFKINMLPRARIAVQFRPLSLAEAKEFFLPGYLEQEPIWESAVEHPDTAMIFSQQLGFEVPIKSTPIQLDYGIRLVVGQYNRTTIKWWLVTIRGAK